MSQEERVAQAVNAITKANLAQAVGQRQDLHDLVNDYFLFPDEFDDSEDSGEDSESETEENDGEDVAESSDEEDPPLVVTDPTQQIFDDEQAKCENFR